MKQATGSCPFGGPAGFKPIWSETWRHHLVLQSVLGWRGWVWPPAPLRPISSSSNTWFHQAFCSLLSFSSRREVSRTTRLVRVASPGGRCKAMLLQALPSAAGLGKVLQGAPRSFHPPALEMFVQLPGSLPGDVCPFTFQATPLSYPMGNFGQAGGQLK